jgi:hypothetical protein
VHNHEGIHRPNPAPFHERRLVHIHPQPAAPSSTSDSHPATPPHLARDAFIPGLHSPYYCYSYNH